MTAALQRLQSLIGTMPIELKDQNSILHWDFGKRLEQQSEVFFQPFVKTHGILTLEYSVLCTRLVHDFTRSEIKKERLIEQLVAALAMAELLTYIYRHCLNVPREVQRLQNEQKVYRLFLKQSGYSFTIPAEMQAQNSSPSQKVRAYTVSLNWPRLFIGRVRRLLVTLSPVAKSWETYSKIISQIDKYAAPILAQASWLFYAPRFVVNLVLLLKHTVPGFWMDDKEKDMDMLVRLQAQLQRRWFELGNDSVWLVGGLLSCFVLVGTLAPVGMYITIGLFLYDVALVGIRAFLELDRLQNLQNDYAARLLGMTDIEEQKELIGYQSYLQERMRFEQKRLFLSVASTAGLFLGMCFALPFLAPISAIPFTGASIVVAVTVISYILGRLLEKQRPVDKVTSLTDSCQASVFKGPHVLFRSDSHEDKKDPFGNVPTLSHNPN